MTAQRLLTSLFEVNEEWNRVENKSVDLAFHVKNAHFAIEGNPLAARVRMSFSIFEEKDLKDVPFRLINVVEGDFGWTNDIPAEQVSALLKTNAPAVLMSYIRPIISIQTSFAGFPALIIPLVDFTSEDLAHSNKN